MNEAIKQMALKDWIWVIVLVAGMFGSYLKSNSDLNKQAAIHELKMDAVCRDISELKKFKDQVNVELINDKINNVQKDVSEIKSLLLSLVRSNSGERHN
jgi:hypothetical protein